MAAFAGPLAASKFSDRSRPRFFLNGTQYLPATGSGFNIVVRRPALRSQRHVCDCWSQGPVAHRHSEDQPVFDLGPYSATIWATIMASPVVFLVAPSQLLDHTSWPAYGVFSIRGFSAFPAFIALCSQELPKLQHAQWKQQAWMKDRET